MAAPTIRVEAGDMLEVLPRLAAEGVRVQAVITDPPYHLTNRTFDQKWCVSCRRVLGAGGDEGRLSACPRCGGEIEYQRTQGKRGFMGRTWDGGDIAFRPDTWRLCWDLLPPGGYLLAFGGTRTFHRLACAIEDAGFEIRDMLAWITGAGFPKGLNVVNQLIRLALWQSQNHARCAAQSSASTQVRSEKAKAPIAVALAQILPEGGPALLTEIGGEVALHVPTDTWPSGWMEHIGLSTTSSLSGSLDDVCSNTSKCITSTASEQTTTPAIYDWLTGLHISATTIRCSVTLPNGSEWPALTAASNLNASNENRSGILIVTALGSAGWNPVARFDGFNVALKPALEPLCFARKPLQGTVAANVQAFGTGALNVGACRIAASDGYTDNAVTQGINTAQTSYAPAVVRRTFEPSTSGRWPANVCHDGSAEVVGAFPDTQSGQPVGIRNANGFAIAKEHGTSLTGFGDSGSAARFFYSAKADAGDRLSSKHPTVKPVDLMRWLVRLVTPPGGTVLDPFAGSGTTAMACLAEGFDCIAVEREAEYVADLRRRIAHVHGTDTPLFADNHIAGKTRSEGGGARTPATGCPSSATAADTPLFMAAD